MNITDKNEVLYEIISNLEYSICQDDYGFEVLTKARYTGLSSIPHAYLCSADGSKLFKITCEEVDMDSLPEEEKEKLNEHININCTKEVVNSAQKEAEKNVRAPKSIRDKN